MPARTRGDRMDAAGGRPDRRRRPRDGRDRRRWDHGDPRRRLRTRCRCRGCRGCHPCRRDRSRRCRRSSCRCPRRGEHRPRRGRDGLGVVLGAGRRGPTRHRPPAADDRSRRTPAPARCPSDRRRGDDVVARGRVAPRRLRRRASARAHARARCRRSARRLHRRPRPPSRAVATRSRGPSPSGAPCRAAAGPGGADPRRPHVADEIDRRRRRHLRGLGARRASLPRVRQPAAVWRPRNKPEWTNVKCLGSRARSPRRRWYAC